MSFKEDIHPAQAGILKVLVFNQSARFSELNTENISNDHFSFHIKKLVELEFIIKNEGGEYTLTTSGKELANRLDTDAIKIGIERQGKIGVLVVCTHEENGEKKYLIQQRLKQPYFGYFGFITGKVKRGEKIGETAARELEEEAGVTADLDLVGIKHKIDCSPENELLEDKYFFVFHGKYKSGELKESFEGGKNQWMTEQQITKIPKLMGAVMESIEMSQNSTLTFSEREHIVEEF